MLAVSAPLHQDFRGAHARFPANGDGWPAFIPPPPPTVQPAFHFCSLLLDPEAYAPRYNPWIKQPKYKAPFDERLRGACQGALRLPAEVFEQILQYAVADGVTGPSLVKSSQSLRCSALPHIYRNVRLKTPESVESFARCLDAHPERAQYVRQLHIETHRVDWDTMRRIARHLSASAPPGDAGSDGVVKQAERVESLSIGIQASDLGLASEFLAAFSPRSFRWRTSPCWLMRPATLYCAFLSKWTRLESLTLEGFRFDGVLAECLRVAPFLRCVTLAGKGCQHLDAATLCAVLQHDRVAKHAMLPPVPCASDALGQYQVCIADCPQQRRDALLHELAAMQSDSPINDSVFLPRVALADRLTWV